MLKRNSKWVIDEVRQLHKIKFRHERKLFIAEGPKVVGELLNSGLNIRFMAGLSVIIEPLEAEYPKIDCYMVTDKELERISTLTSPNKILAVAEMPVSEDPLDRNFINENIVILDGINDPGNMGTIIRTAEWFGVKQILCSSDSVDCWNPKVVQGAMGSLFRMNIWYGDLIEMISKAKNRNTHVIVGAALHGMPLSQMKHDKPCMLVIGSESHGISPQLSSLLPVKVAIPGAVGVQTESLNASVACGIILYELNN